MNELYYCAAKEFLEPIYENTPLLKDRPFTTLTFAQSLDGKISKKGQHLLISGKESMAMTHRLRSLHDGIMVGIGTALIDDPQLNVRLLSASDLKEAKQPQPIILDPFLALSPACKLIKNYQSGNGKQVWLIASRQGCIQNEAKKYQLDQLGVKILMIDTEGKRHIPLSKVLDTLKSQGINSLMIEGGSKIIQSCLTESVWDRLIVTIAPKAIGLDGVPAMTQASDSLKDVKYQVMGNDIVLFASK